MELITDPTTNKMDKGQVASINRFTGACVACLGLIMQKTNEYHPELDNYIKLYLDCMVDVDEQLLLIGNNANEGNNNPKNKLDNKTTTNKKNVIKKGKPNYIKSNSLGILVAAEAHKHFGPAELHWEGGIGGEKKIQTVKPYLSSLKKSNIDWQSHCLEKIVKSDCISLLLSMHECKENKKINTSMNLYVYKTSDDAINDITENKPLFGVYLKGIYYLVLRKISEDNLDNLQDKEFMNSLEKCRSSLFLMEITFCDNVGEDNNGCWHSPIKANGNFVSKIKNAYELIEYVEHFVLFLPLLKQNGEFENKYYVISHLWKERNKNGNMDKYNVHWESFDAWKK